jgi:hypothetical protein
MDSVRVHSAQKGGRGGRETPDVHCKIMTVSEEKYTKASHALMHQRQSCVWHWLYRIQSSHFWGTVTTAFIS